MANLIFLLISLPLLFTTLTFIPFTAANAISSCNEPCQTLDDCDGPLICIFGRCKGDPFIEFHMCHKHHLPHHRGGGDHCKSSGTVTCNGKEYHTYKCSPKVTYSTRAKLTHNDFSKYEDGGGDGWRSWKCDERYNRDERYHRESERVVALSTGWYNGGSRCGKNIRITARNGRSTTAKVVDECDSRRGCDEKHGYRPPCKNNVVDGSDAVWRALGLDKNVGVVDITWSMT